jgi:hypothetical protein
MPDGPTVAGPRLAMGYARKSDEDQLGIVDQHNLLRAQARMDGYVIPDNLLFADEDVSGLAPSRSGLDRMFETARDPFGVRPERAYVLDKTRFGRWKDIGYHDHFRILLKEAGVQLWFARGTNVDYSNGMTSAARAAALEDRIEGIDSNAEVVRIVTRSRRGKRNRILHGLFPGGTHPYATRRALVDVSTMQVVQRIQPGRPIRIPNHAYRLEWSDPVELEAVRRIYQWLDVEDLSFRGIARRLNEEGYPPPAVAPRRPPGSTRDTPKQTVEPRWRSTGVKRVATNPLYRGDLIWGRTTSDLAPVPPDPSIVDLDTPILAAGIMRNPPIARDQWERVQEVIRRRDRELLERRTRASTFLLSGRLFCARCAGRLSGARYRAPGGGIYLYYRHSQRWIGGRYHPAPPCSAERRSVCAMKLESAVVRHLVRELFDDEFTEEVRRELERYAAGHTGDDHQRRICEIANALPRRRAALESASRAVSEATSEIERSAHLRTSQEIAGDIERLAAEQARLEGEARRARNAIERVSPGAITARALVEAFDEQSIAMRKVVIRRMVGRITVDTDTGDVRVAFQLAQT